MADVDDFAATLRRVANGGSALDPLVVSRLPAAHRDEGPLKPPAPRERDVIQLLAKGPSNRAVAERLDISLGSTEKYVSSIPEEARSAGHGASTAACSRCSGSSSLTALTP